jgi:hypothetical protein
MLLNSNLLIPAKAPGFAPAKRPNYAAHSNDRNLSRESARNRPPKLSSSTRPNAGSRDGVARNIAAVDVVLDALISRSVKRSTSNTLSIAAARVRRTGTSDLDVDALRVRLRAVFLASTVQSDDFVTQDVVARGEGLGDVDGPLVAVGDELVGAPLVGGGVDDTRRGELEEGEGLLVGGGAVALALGEVVDDGAVVGLGPGVPLQGHGAAGGDGDGGFAGGGFLGLRVRGCSVDWGV